MTDIKWGAEEKNQNDCNEASFMLKKIKLFLRANKKAERTCRDNRKRNWSEDNQQMIFPTNTNYISGNDHHTCAAWSCGKKLSAGRELLLHPRFTPLS